MKDHSSRPHPSPNKPPHQVAARVISRRLRLREQPIQLAARTGITPSTVHPTVHRILASARLNRSSQIDRATSESVRRDEHDHPGTLVHVDIKKPGIIPDDRGWRFVGYPQGAWNHQRSVWPEEEQISPATAGTCSVPSVMTTPELFTARSMTIRLPRLQSGPGSCRGPVRSSRRDH